MKIVVLSNYDLASALALEYLKPTLAAHDCRVFHTRKPAPTQNPKLAELAHYEQLALAEQSQIFDSLQSQQLNYINRQDFQRFADSRPDLVISIRHMSILKSDVIKLPTLGVINLHSGLLPNYQGVMASFWAMASKEPQLGTTLHFIEDSSIDTGSVIAQSYTTARYDKSYLWNVLNLYRAGCENIRATIEALANHELISSTPQTGDASYFSYPGDDELGRFAPPLFGTNDRLSEFL